MAITITSCLVRYAYRTAYKSLKCGQNKSWTEHGIRRYFPIRKITLGGTRYFTNWNSSPTVNEINLRFRNRRNQSPLKLKFWCRKPQSREKVTQNSNARVTSQFAFQKVTPTSPLFHRFLLRPYMVNPQYLRQSTSMLHNAHPDCLQHTVVDLENHLEPRNLHQNFPKWKISISTPPPRCTSNL